MSSKKLLALLAIAVSAASFAVDNTPPGRLSPPQTTAQKTRDAAAKDAASRTREATSPKGRPPAGTDKK
ncbi:MULTISPECIES: hypothetical protein [unclassified Variovorax]|uniref:hypothetical protein n=1 Tax=unclassified Variovorax TaxID=663243 RepID=UPI003ECE1675